NKKKDNNNNDDNDDSSKSSAKRAQLVVQLPSDAKLYIDNRLMKAKTGQRVFRTPELKNGQVYYYMLRVEVVRNGKKVAETRRGLVRAGQKSEAAFTEPKTEMVVSKD